MLLDRLEGCLRWRMPGVMRFGLLIVPILAWLEMTPLRAEDAAITVSRAWARPTIGASATTAGYVTLRNSGSKPDRLVAAQSELASAIEIHMHVMDGDIARMRRVDDVAIAPGQSAEFNPGGLHLMVLGLKRPLKAGETLPLKLTFQTAGVLAVNAVVSMTAPPNDAASSVQAPAAGHHH